MIEVKKESVKVSGDKRIIKAEFTMLVYSLVDSGQFTKEEIEEAVKRGFMTGEERKAEIEKKLQEVADKMREASKDSSKDKSDDEIKQAIDTIVKHFTENM